MKDHYQKNVTVQLIKDLLNQKQPNLKPPQQQQQQQQRSKEKGKKAKQEKDKNSNSPRKVNEVASGTPQTTAMRVSDAAKSPASSPYVADIEAKQFGSSSAALVSY